VGGRCTPWSAVALCLALAAGVGARAEDDPVPFVREAAMVRTGARIAGFGGTFAFGVVGGDRPFLDLGRLTFDGAFEARLFPAPEFSIDLQLDIGESVRESIDLDDRIAVHFRTFFHFHPESDAVGYFSPAGYVGFRLYPGGIAPVGVVELGARIGAEMQSRDGTFAMGFYFRPGVHFARDIDGEPRIGYEIVLELTWIKYLLAAE